MMVTAISLMRRWVRAPLALPNARLKNGEPDRMQKRFTRNARKRPMQRKVFLVLNLPVLLFRNYFPQSWPCHLPSLSLSVNHRVCAYAPV